MIKARIEANLTLGDVAQKLHTRKSNISRLESLNAKHLANLGTLMQYVEVVGQIILYLEVLMQYSA